MKKICLSLLVLASTSLLAGCSGTKDFEEAMARAE